LDIKAALLRDGITLDERFYERVERYKAHLAKWNRIHNLTGAKSDDVIDAFIYDAVYPVSFLPKVRNAMDIGTGAGFPGLILAMAMPETDFTLVEPIQKRASFLQFVKADLKLGNVTVENCRVEELAPKAYDLVTSRAVTDTKMLMKLSEPFVRKGSQLLFYKGEKVFDEVDPSLKHRIIHTGNRHYLIIEP
jgi:16S rRNA (guanine527-N7)-methyltransferase